MNIIFVSNQMARARTLAVWQVALIALALIIVPVLLTLLFIVPQDAAAQKGGKSLIPSQLRFSFNNSQKHLDAYAVQLGEMQARMMRLDAQSERLGKLAGTKPPIPITAIDKTLPSIKEKLDGKGGPLVLQAPIASAMTEDDLQKSIVELSERIQSNTDYLGKVEAKILQQGVLKDMLPNSSPVSVGYRSSSYGWRKDPFTNQNAFHEGLDFPAPSGTPIYAAAGGIFYTA